MSTPLVSVILPVYGVERYIGDCLRSLLAQTFRQFEIILVDDESPDRSIAIACDVLEGSEIPYRILRQSNQGQGPARDYGIREAQGDYVLCLDSDDTVSPNFLESLYRAAAQADADVAFCLFRMVPEGEKAPYSGETPVYQGIEREEMLRHFLCRTLIPILPSMLLRKELILSRGLTTRAGCRFSEDVYFMWLVFAAAKTTVYTTAPLYHYLQRGNSTMTASSRQRILTGYEAFCQLVTDSRFSADFTGAEYLLPRWVLGALNSSARICDFAGFMDIAEQMDYKRHMAALKGFPERKARILSGLLRCCPKLYYRLLHRS